MISIIIPVLNESKRIRKLIDHLYANAFGYIGEIIVVDGGSTDDIKAELFGYSNVRYIQSGKGRAKQMNAGAIAAERSILYFLHADSFPPKHFDRAIFEVLLVNNNIGAGCFMLRFDNDHWWLKLMGWATIVNHNVCRGGDQSLFVNRELFFALNGFDEDYEVYEDIELIKRLYRSTKFKLIKEPIITSARHYEKIGVWRLQWLHLRIYFKGWAGVGAEELNSFTRKELKH
nr:TIGR04283 family arsenosugar biosynthesis glycosyltransferase [uncultured Allomuricauda sp.]